MHTFIRLNKDIEFADYQEIRREFTGSADELKSNRYLVARNYCYLEPGEYISGMHQSERDLAFR
jgi:hypothetical protein